MLDAHGDGMERRRIVVGAARQEHANLAGHIDHGERGHDQRVLVLFHGEARARIHAGLQTEGRVGNFDFHLRRAGGRIQNRRDARDAAVEGFAGEGIDFDVGVVPTLIRRRSFLDDVDDEPDRPDIDDRHE